MADREPGRGQVQGAARVGRRHDEGTARGGRAQRLHLAVTHGGRQLGLERGVRAAGTAAEPVVGGEAHVVGARQQGGHRQVRVSGRVGGDTGPGPRR